MLLPVDLHKTDHTLRLKRTYTRLTGWNTVHSSVTETKAYLHASDTIGLPLAFWVGAHLMSSGLIKFRMSLIFASSDARHMYMCLRVSVRS